MFNFAPRLSLNFSSCFSPSFFRGLIKCSLSSSVFIRTQGSLFLWAQSQTFLILPCFLFLYHQLIFGLMFPAECLCAKGKRGEGSGVTELHWSVPKKRSAVCHFWMVHLIDVLFLSEKSCLWQRLDIFDWLDFFPGPLQHVEPFYKWSRKCL